MADSSRRLNDTANAFFKRMHDKNMEGAPKEPSQAGATCEHCGQPMPKDPVQKSIDDQKFVGTK